MAFTDDAAEALRRAARRSGRSRLDALEDAFPDRPLLRSTLEGYLAGKDTSWLETGGAWSPGFEQRIHETLRREPLALGDRVGEIRLLERLGSGGMGTVYLGFDERLEREVAVKTVSLDGGLRPLARERFEREAKVLSRLNHPAICQIYSVIDASVGELSFQCLVLERVQGRTLREAMGDLDPDARLWALEQVARALAVAHGEGIIHRDLKPDNVMLTPGGGVKILDFGISRFSDAGSPDPGEDDLDETGGHLIGTPRYMSPEQALCEPLSPASDLYSLGLLLKEAVTDAPAHPEASTPFDLVRRAAEAQVDPVDDSVDWEIAGLIRELVAREPSARPSASDAADCIRHVLDRPLRRRRRRLRLAVGVVLALALTVAAWGTVSAWHARRDIERQSLAARRLGEEVRSVDSLLRAAHLAPPHDVGTERRWVEERLRRIEEEYSDAGPWAAGPLAYAQGRIALALGRPDEARKALENGWDLGYRDRNLAEALGLAIGALYDRATDEARRLATEDQRRAALEQADREFREPAVQWLERASASGTGGQPLGSLSGAWVALYENNFDEARVLASRAFAEAPWLYEAPRIVGLAALRQASVLENAGQLAEAVTKMSQAETAFDQALDVARSDPELHLERCGLGDEAISVAYRAGQDGRAPYGRAVEACRGARDLLPRSAEPWLVEALVEYILAWSRSEVLQDPTEALDRLSVAARRALELAPDSAEAYRLLGLEASERGQWATAEGESSQPHFEAAEVLLRKAVELEPGSAKHRYALGVAQFSLGYDELFQGVDPRPTLRRAAESLRQAQRLSPSSSSAPSMMGSTYGVMAMYALDKGLDPLDPLRRCISAFQLALSIDPTAPAPRGNLAMAYRDLATYHWLVGADSAELESAVDRGRSFAEALIADKPDSIARITWGELELLRARSRIERGLDAATALDTVLRQAEELDELDVAGHNARRLRVEALLLKARAATGRSDDVDRLTRRALREIEIWLRAGGGHQPWILRASLAEVRAAAGLERDAEIRHGLEAVNSALKIRDDSGDAYLVKARLLALAGQPSPLVQEALSAAVFRNPWLERQAHEIGKEIAVPMS